MHQLIRKGREVGRYKELLQHILTPYFVVSFTLMTVNGRKGLKREVFFSPRPQEVGEVARFCLVEGILDIHTLK